jgi:hypothetical protein
LRHALSIAAALLMEAALAQTSHYTATLAQPLAAPREVFANENIFRCRDSTCVLVSRPVDVASVSVCSTLRYQLRTTLISYGNNEHPMEAADLAKCNGSK